MSGGLADLVRETLHDTGHHVVSPGEEPDRTLDAVVDVAERGDGDRPATDATPGSRPSGACSTSPYVRGARLVLVSSALVYAPVPDPERWPITEAFPRRAHGDPGSRAFGESCIELEDLVTAEARARDMEFVVLRPTVLCGSASGSYADVVLEDLEQRPWAGAREHEGVGTMQWVDVSDAAEAVALAVDAPGAANEVLNVAGEEAFTAAELAAFLRTGRLPGGPLKFDTVKTQVLLGWSPSGRLADMVAPVGAPARGGRRSWWERQEAGS